MVVEVEVCGGKRAGDCGRKGMARETSRVDDGVNGMVWGR